MILVDKETALETYKNKRMGNQNIEKHDQYFPVVSSISLAEITADLLTDGFMDIRKRYNSKYFGYIGYFSKETLELEKFKENVLKIFGINGTIREWGIRKYGESKGVIFTNSFLTRILHCCGVPGGDKVIQSYEIPKWIINSSAKIKKAFLRRLFTCEGSIGYDINDKRWEIKYSMYKHKLLSENLEKFLNQIKNLLSEFSIKSEGPYKKEKYIRKKDGKPVIGKYIRIKEKESMKIFENEISFDLKYKQEKLKIATS